MAAKSRPKRLYQLSIHPGGLVPHFTMQKFRRETIHIALMFERYLTKVQKYALDGSSSMTVYFGMQDRLREILGPKYYHQEPKSGSSICCIPRFDLIEFMAMSETEQDERTTALLEKALLAVAKQVGADTKPIRDAAKMVRAGNYTARFPIEHFSCKNPTRDRTARVWSCITRGFVRWQVCVEDAMGQVVRADWIPDECYRLPDFTEELLVSRWDKQGFTLRNKQGRIRFALPPETSGE
jgi:HAMP domain-containing protein